MLNFFISYRREDSIAYAGRLYDWLSAHFVAESVFMDIATLEPGIDFVEVIKRAMSQCDILLVLIGPRWLSAADAMGQRRLDNPEDTVRVEIQAGLDRDIRVIPVLVGGAAMPSSRDLPAALTKLARRNTLELSDTRWHTDVGKLLEVAEKLSVELIIDWMINEFKKSEGLDLSRDNMALQRLKDAAKKASMELASTQEAEINLPFIAADASGPKHLLMRLTRERLQLSGKRLQQNYEVVDPQVVDVEFEDV